MLDLPMDIQRQMIGVSSPSSFAVDTQQAECVLDDRDIDEILEAISSSKSPIILAGGGCSASESKNELLKFAERSNIPVVVSLMAKDAFPHNHRLFGGFIGAYGNRYGNILLAKSDLLIVLGSRLDSRQIGNELSPFLNKRIIRIDIDKDEIESSKLRYRTTLVCDVKQFLTLMNLTIEREKVVFPKNEEHILNIQQLKERFDPISEMRRAHEEDWHYRVMKGISDNLADDDIVCVDVGQNQMLAAQVLSIRRNQRFINSGGMAPMGYALPAAVALSIETKKGVVVITGDGGMQINIQELNNVASHKLPIIIFVFNNKSLGMIKQFQKMYFNSNYFATDEKSGYNSCNFTEIARAYGIGAIQIRQNENAILEVAKILQEPRMPLLVEFVMDYESYVYPKLEYNKPIDEIDPPLDGEEKKFVESMSLENPENRETNLSSSELGRRR